jgi:hypothetical protein
VVETIQSKRRSRLVRIGSTVGVLIAAGLVAWGFSRSNDDRLPKSDTPPTIGVIGGPADVMTTQGAVGSPSVTTPSTADVAVVPNGTLDIALPPVSSDIATP